MDAFCFFVVLLWSHINPSMSQTTCTSTLTGEISTYTAAVGSSCSSVTCLDGYDCDVTCGSHACAFDINGPDSAYDLSLDCTAANGCQRANIEMSHSETSDFAINCGGLYACEQTQMFSPQSGSLDFDCVFDKTCEHFYLTASNLETDGFLNIDLSCTAAHSCYDFWLDGTSNFNFGNVQVFCEGSNSCQNSFFYQALYGSFAITCSGQLSCAGSELGIILNNNDPTLEVVNSLEGGTGEFGCLGQLSCQGTTLYCPNYQDCSITCQDTNSCDSLVAYCPKYGGNCVVSCENNDQACNSIELHTYNGNYEITNCGSGCDTSITVVDTTIDLTNIEIEIITSGDLDEVTIEDSIFGDSTSANSNKDAEGNGMSGSDSIILAVGLSFGIVFLLLAVGVTVTKCQNKKQIAAVEGVYGNDTEGGSVQA